MNGQRVGPGVVTARGDRLDGVVFAQVDRVRTNAAGQVVLKLKTAWRDGPAGRAWPVARPFARHKQSTGLFVSGLSTTHLVMSPLEFMQRLASPRLCHGHVYI